MLSRNANSFSLAQKPRNCLQRPMLPKGEQQRHEGITLLTTLSLANGMHNVVVLPNVCARLPVEPLVHSPPCHPATLPLSRWSRMHLSHRLTRRSIRDPPHRELTERGQHTHIQREFRAQMLRHGSRDKPPDNVSNHDATHTATCLLQNCDPSQLENVHGGLWDLNCCQRF